MSVKTTVYSSAALAEVPILGVRFAERAPHEVFVGREEAHKWTFVFDEKINVTLSFEADGIYQYVPHQLQSMVLVTHYPRDNSRACALELMKQHFTRFEISADLMRPLDESDHGWIIGRRKRCKTGLWLMVTDPIVKYRVGDLAVAWSDSCVFPVINVNE